MKSLLLGITLACAGLGQDLDPAALLNPPADSWPGYHGDYSGRRHSGLDADHAVRTSRISDFPGCFRPARTTPSSARRCW